MRMKLAGLTPAIATAAAPGNAQEMSCDADIARLQQDARLGARIDDAAPEVRQHLRSPAHAADGLRDAGYDPARRGVVGAVEDMARRGAVHRRNATAGRSRQDNAWSMFGG